MEFTTPRRRFLEAIGAGTAVSVAGCNALQDQSDAEGDGGGGGGERTVAAAVQPDQEALQQAREEIGAQVQNGELSRQEAQQEFQTTRQELLANATDSFEGSVSESEGIAVDDSVSELGVFLVTGESTGLIDLLALDPVGALLSESSFEEAQSRAGAASGTGTETQSG